MARKWRSCRGLIALRDMNDRGQYGSGPQTLGPVLGFDITPKPAVERAVGGALLLCLGAWAGYRYGTTRTRPAAKVFIQTERKLTGKHSGDRDWDGVLRPGGRRSPKTERAIAELMEEARSAKESR